MYLIQALILSPINCLNGMLSERFKRPEEKWSAKEGVREFLFFLCTAHTIVHFTCTFLHKQKQKLVRLAKLLLFSFFFYYFLSINCFQIWFRSRSYNFDFYILILMYKSKQKRSALKESVFQGLERNMWLETM